jgi:chemotaxis protein MotB
MRKIIAIVAFSILAFSCVPTSQFKEVNTKSNDLQKDRDGLMAENEALTVENTEMKAKITDVREMKEKFIKDSVRLYNLLDETNQDLAELERVHGELEQSHEALLRGNARETRRLLNELQATQTDLAKKQELLENLEGNVTEQRQNVTRLRAELEARNARLLEMENMLYRKDSLMNALKTTVSNALLGFEGQGLTVTQRNGKVYVSLDEKLLFTSGSTVVDPNGELALRQLAGALAKNPDISIMIEGHTDDVPFRKGSSIKDNWDLSVMRATSIVRILQSASNIDPKRITVAGRGEYLPVDSADSSDARRKNRRTEIILSPNLDELYKLLELN